MPNVETTYFQLWSWASNLWLVGVDSPWVVFSPVPRVEAQRATFRFAYLFLCFLVHFCTSCLIWLFTMWVLKFPVFSRETAGSSRCPRPAASFRARKNLYEGILCRALDNVTVGAGHANPKRVGSPLGAQAATLRHGSWKQPWPGGISSSGRLSSALGGLSTDWIRPARLSRVIFIWNQPVMDFNYTYKHLQPNTQIGVWLTNWEWRPRPVDT